MKKIRNYLNKIKARKAQCQGIAFAMALTVLFGNGLFYLPGAIVTAEETTDAVDSTVVLPDAGGEGQDAEPEGELTDEPQQPDEETDPDGEGTEEPEADNNAGISTLAEGDLEYLPWNVTVACQNNRGPYKTVCDIDHDSADVWGYVGDKITIRAEITLENNVDPNGNPLGNGFAFDGPTAEANEVLGALPNPYVNSIPWVQNPDNNNPSKWRLDVPVDLRGEGSRSIYLYVNGEIKKTLNVAVKEKVLDEPMFIKSSYITWAEDQWLNKDDATNMMDGKWAEGSPESGIWSEINSEDTPLTIYIGGTLEVKAKDGTAGTHLVYQDVEGGDGILNGTSNGTAGTYTGMKPGVCKIEVQNDDNNVLSTLWVQVKYPIYIDIGSGGIHKDKTHEYLDVLDWDHNLKFLDDDAKDNCNHLYIKNAEDQNGSYVIIAGESRELIGYSNDPETRFELIEGQNTNLGDLVHQKVEDWKVPGIYRITAIYKPQQDSYAGDWRRTNTIQFGNENFYVQVYRGTATATHADIEVEDGGSYRDSFTVYHADGSKTVISSKYSAEVVYVNQCNIFYNDSEMKNGLTEEQYNSAARVINSEEYGDLRTGGTQHEFTSAYQAELKTEADTSIGEYKDEDGKVRDKHGNIMYKALNDFNHVVSEEDRPIYRAYLDHVVFDVQLALTLIGTSAVSYDASGKVKELDEDDQKYLDAVQKKILLENFVYTMDDAAIAAAYNKCPNRSGLDFKLVADVNQFLIEVNPQILKTVNDKEPGNGNRFEFGLYSDAACTVPVLNEAKELITATSDENGIALFSADALVFTGEGTHTFYIKEIVSGTPIENMKYDTHVEKVTIEVARDSNDQLTANITYSSGGDTATFNNITKYFLPDAGGTGSRPYVISGVMLMQAAILLFYLHRRRGARC